MASTDDLLRTSMDLCAMGRFDEAASLLNSIIAKSPKQPEARRQLGLIEFQAGRRDAALAHLEAASRAAPSRTDIRMLLGFLLLHAGQAERGRALLSFVGADPRTAKGAAIIGDLAAQLGDPAFAESQFQTVLSLEPSNTDARLRCASSQHRTGRAADAAATLRAGLAFQPGNVQLQHQLANVLPYSHAATAAQMRDDLSALGKLISASAPRPAPHNPDRNPDRPLRIGYLAQDLGSGSAIARFIQPALAHHDRAGFKITGYLIQPTMAQMTPALKAAADAWLDCTALSDDVLAAKIRSDGTDILVDLAGQTFGSRAGVLARRPAPIQITFIGDAKTTGLDTVDFKLIDAITDPPGAEAAYTEKLVRLDDCFLCFSAHHETPEPRPPPGPGITFASFNVPEKIGPDVVALWARVLSAVPASTLLLKATSYGYEYTRRIYRDRFAAHGIAPERLRLLGHVPLIREHFSHYHSVDIALDPFPYNGTTTTCDALWMGVPIVTLRGTLHAGRVSASLLTAVGLSDLIADSPDDYIAIAAALAADQPRRTELRHNLRARMAASVLGDAPRYARKIDQTYRRLWHEYCATPR